jgi:hypothetical protein
MTGGWTTSFQGEIELGADIHMLREGAAHG